MPRWVTDSFPHVARNVVPRVFHEGLAHGVVGAAARVLPHLVAYAGVSARLQQELDAPQPPGVRLFEGLKGAPDRAVERRRFGDRVLRVDVGAGGQR